MPEFDESSVSEYLIWQYGIYASFGMSYDEFWNKDYRLVAAYKKKHDMDIEREQTASFELAVWIRDAIVEFSTHAFGEKGKKKHTFPTEIEPRTGRAKYLKERQKSIDQEFNRYLRERKQSREKDSNG